MRRADHDLAGGEVMTREALMTSPLQITQSARGATATIGLKGELDLAGTQVLGELTVQMLDRHPSCLVLDISALTFIDVSGVRAAIEVWERSVAQNVSLKIIPGSRAVHHVFELCRLTDVLPFITRPDRDCRSVDAAAGGRGCYAVAHGRLGSRPAQ